MGGVSWSPVVSRQGIHVRIRRIIQRKEKRKISFKFKAREKIRSKNLIKRQENESAVH